MTKNPGFHIRKFAGLALLTVSFLASSIAYSQNSPSQMLFDFENKFDISRVILTDSKSNLLTEGQNHVLKVFLQILRGSAA